MEISLFASLLTYKNRESKHVLLEVEKKSVGANELVDSREVLSSKKGVEVPPNIMFGFCLAARATKIGAR